MSNYQAESPHALKRQRALKEEIVAADYEPRYYSFLEQLSDQIVADMKEAITSVFPSSGVDITVAGRWRLQHKVFASYLSVGYVPPKGIMLQMDEAVKHSPIVVVKGASGVVCGIFELDPMCMHTTVSVSWHAAKKGSQ